MTQIRSPICAIEGHVDHGKTSILDQIRGSSIVKGEAGAITQAIGASIIPLETIKKICGPLLGTLKTKLTIPGLLFIDTPGHAAFTALRKRGGNLADIAIVVIDINEGIMPQTQEAIEILKQYKTPFIIAANKIDLIPGWKSNKDTPILQNIQKQDQNTIQKFETKLYELVGKLSELGLNSERFDRVEDYTKQIAIIPTSAQTREGIPELLMVMTGLAQKYLEECLKCNIQGSAKGIVLEVKEEKGLGKTLDIIVYDGTLKINDIIVIGSLDQPIVTKIKALFEPAPLAEMRDKKTKFTSVKQVTAATGVKISASEIGNVVSGMPIRSTTKEDIEKIKQEIQKEVEEVLIETNKDGIIVKADTLGSLEAVDKLLKEKEITIKKASIGNINKKDISEAESIAEKDPLKGIILGFNVKIDVKDSKIKILTNNVIYKLIEDFEKWKISEKKRQESEKIGTLTLPCKLEFLKGYIFRQNNPAIFGVEISNGTLKSGITLMNKQGKNIGEVKQIQLDKETVEQAEKNKQVAVSVEGPTIGRQINEGDILYSSISEEDFRKLKDLKKNLTKDQIEILKEIAEIKRKDNPVWGI